MFDTPQGAGLNGLVGQTTAANSLVNSQEKVLQVAKAENGFVLTNFRIYPNTNRVYTDFDSLVADLKEYFS